MSPRSHLVPITMRWPGATCKLNCGALDANNRWPLKRDDDRMAAPIAARGSLRNARRDRRLGIAVATTSCRASCSPSPTVRAAQMTRPVRESVRNCFAASCFLHYQSDAARRFADRSLSCAAGAAAQAPLGLNADCKTAFMCRVLGRQGSRIWTPFGASLSHLTHRRCRGRGSCDYLRWAATGYDGSWASVALACREKSSRIATRAQHAATRRLWFIINAVEEAPRNRTRTVFPTGVGNDLPGRVL